MLTSADNGGRGGQPNAALTDQGGSGGLASADITDKILKMNKIIYIFFYLT